MSATWKTLLSLTEASEKDRLFTHIIGAYGEDALDQVKDKIDKAWNPEGLHGLYQDLTMQFGDPKTREILNKAAEKMGARPSAAAGSASVQKRSAGSDVAEPVGPSRKDRIAGLASGDVRSPSDVAAQKAATAATAASRPDRAGTQANVPPSKGAVAVPGERPTHDVGTAGQSPGSAPGHTRPVQHQTSQSGGLGSVHASGGTTAGQQMAYLQGLLDKDPEHPQADKIQKAIASLQSKPEDEPLRGPTPIPSTTGGDLEGLRGSVAQMTQRYNMLPTMIKQLAHQAMQLRQTNPAKSRELAQRVNQMRGEYTELPKKIRDAEAGISRITQVGKSGLSDAQRQVDQVTKAYPNSKIGDKLAKKLGVPPTSARTRTVVDPDTGKETTKTSIWSAEKIAKWRESGPELEPGTYDMPAGGPRLPGPDAERQPAAPGEKKLHKPMMKAPKGLSQPELKQLADLRRDFARLKKSGAEEAELALKRDEINAIMSKGGEMVDVVMPGAFDGQPWQPSGMSKQVRTMRPDKATGKMVYGKRDTDPRKEGQMLVWSDSANDWLLPSQKVSQDAEKGAALRAGGAEPKVPGPGERRPHASQSQMVKGTPVSTSADRQKAQAASEPPPEKDATRGHRANKDAVQQAFFGKKKDEPAAAD